MNTTVNDNQKVCTDDQVMAKLKSFSCIYFVGIEPMLSKFYERFNECFNASADLKVVKVVSTTQKSKDDGIEAALKGVKDALLISAYNLYIFKDETVDNNTIINYHNALLPWHRGVMATVWAVWAGDSEAGMSWHIVDRGIDTGAVLVQRAVEVAPDLDAITLSAQINNLALQSLSDAIENLVHGKRATLTRTVDDELHGYHALKDRPNHGVFDRTWDQATASRFLRAMYAAKMNQVKAPEIEIDGKKHAFLKWKFKENILTIKTVDGISETIEYKD